MCKVFKNKFYKNYNIINQAVSDKNKSSLFYENEILSQSSLYKNKNKFNKIITSVINIKLSVLA